MFSVYYILSVLFFRRYSVNCSRFKSTVKLYFPNPLIANGGSSEATLKILINIESGLCLLSKNNIIFLIIGLYIYKLTFTYVAELSENSNEYPSMCELNIILLYSTFAAEMLLAKRDLNCTEKRNYKLTAFLYYILLINYSMSY